MPAKTEATAATENDTPRRRLTARLVAHVAVWMGLGLAVSATVYLAVMAIQWHSRVEELRTVQHDLTSALTVAHAEYQTSSDSLDDARADHQAMEDDLVVLVDDKAQAQDYGYLFQDMAQALAQCADAEAENVRMLRVNHATPGDPVYLIPFWVDDWCRELTAELDDLSAEAEEEFS